MDNRTSLYIEQQLAYTGFVITSVYYAHKLRPDLFNSAQSAVGLLGAGRAFFRSKLYDVQPFNVVFENGNDAQVWSRTKKGLAARIEWLLGLPVASISEISEPNSASQRTQAQESAERAKAEHIAKLRKLAAQDLPAHDCSNRREILAARDELKAMEIIHD